MQPIPERTKPLKSIKLDTVEATFILLSTSGPNNAAPIPRKNMFRQNVNCTAAVEAPIAAAICGINKLNA